MNCWLSTAGWMSRSAVVSDMANAQGGGTLTIMQQNGFPVNKELLDF
jgi:hypothetical protein